jgi:glycosyltransferase involved in cell wall biosynthesis
MFETDRIDPNWAAACNGMDEVWVPTEFNRQTFAASGVDPDKLHVVPLGLDVEHYRPDRVRALPLAGKSGFNFLAVFEWNKRKGYDVLLRAYAAEFTSDDDVTLFVRTYGYAAAGRRVQGEQQLREYFLSLCPDPGRAPKLVFLLDKIPDEHMPALYAACDSFVLPTRGEGWGMPILEAMACGVPAIATNWSGPRAFLNAQNGYPLPIRGLTPAGSDSPDYRGAQWAEPDEAALVDLLRHAAKNRSERAAKGQQAALEARRWPWSRGVDAICARLAQINNRP